MSSLRNSLDDLEVAKHPLTSEDHLDIIETHGAKHYKPLPIVLHHAKDVWMYDLEGNRYLDMLSSYSAVNQGHMNPKIVEAMAQQLGRMSLCSTAFNHDQLAPLLQRLSFLTRKGMSLLMNSGAEAVETAIKLTRKWASIEKGIAPGKAEIIVFDGNFHGRTTTIVSFSSEPKYKLAFGPHTPGFVSVPYNDIAAVEKAINPNTAGILFEPIQGEGGINVPDEGFLTDLAKLCEQENVLLIADEIQTGLGRTGKMFACDYEGVNPDILILGKALSGGMYPVSAVCSQLLYLFKPGEHGSTYGGNALACAVANAALRVITDERLDVCAARMGAYFKTKLEEMNAPCVKEVRGKGLLLGVELLPEYGSARPYCERLMGEGILCKETHDSVIRFAPPLTIDKETVDWALTKIEKVLKGVNSQPTDSPTPS